MYLNNMYNNNKESRPLEECMLDYQDIYQIISARGKMIHLNDYSTILHFE